MKPINFEQSNMTMTAHDCDGLPVAHAITPSDLEVYISCWELSDEELQQIIKTKQIWLWQFGDHVQPVAVAVEHPFDNKTENEQELLG